MEIIDGKYRVETRQLGKGGFSEVYLGTDLITGLKVAIKKINLTQKTAPERSLLAKLQTEIEIMQRLDHPNIVKYYDVVKSPHFWYIIMEYCDRGTLQDVIDYHNDPLTASDLSFNREANTWYYMDQLRNALNYLQSMGYTHRDIKPMNVLLVRASASILRDSGILGDSNILGSNSKTLSDSSTPLFDLEQSDDLQFRPDELVPPAEDTVVGYNWTERLVVKLADFGLTKSHRDQEHAMNRTICGSPLYMAPELIMQESYDSKIDLWAFGIIMYQLLHGSHPFHAISQPQLIRNIKARNIDFHLHKNFTNRCFDLLTKLLINDPLKRISWRDLFNHDWFNYWLTHINSDSLPVIHDCIHSRSDPISVSVSGSDSVPKNHVPTKEPFDYQSSFRRRSSKPIHIDPPSQGSDSQSQSNLGSSRLGAFHVSSSPSFSSQIGHTNTHSHLQTNIHSQANTHSQAHTPPSQSPLGPSNLSRMKLEGLSLGRLTQGTYDDYPASYPVTQAHTHSQAYTHTHAHTRTPTPAQPISSRPNYLGRSIYGSSAGNPSLSTSLLRSGSNSRFFLPAKPS